MNLVWHAFSGGALEEWCLSIEDQNSVYDDRVMANVIRRGHRLYEIEWWESPEMCECRRITFEGSLMEAQAYAAALVRMT